MPSEFNTPMMKQYLGIKKQYQDCLLFYRMGDFYELFLEDAHIGAKVLGITLTSRSKGRDGRIPMAGVPYHAVDGYLSKLVKAGYRVAICEQLSEPNSKGLVDRDVVRVVTPGTVLDEKALEKKENNYIISVAIKKDTVAVALCDLSTGEFVVDEQESEHPEEFLHQLIGHYHPVECLLSSALYEDTDFIKELRTHSFMHLTRISTWQTQARHARNFLTTHFGLHTLESFEIHSMLLAQEAAALLLGYLFDTQKGKISHIKAITRVQRGQQLVMDRATQINLELFSTIREHDMRGSLLSILDHTQTAMGGRMLKRWMSEPLSTHEKICERLEAVDELLSKKRETKSLRGHLENIHDIERMLSRLSVGIGNARDLINLKNALTESLASIETLADFSSDFFKGMLGDGTDQYKVISNLKSVTEHITATILPEPKITLKEGGLIQPGVDKTLDSLRSILSSGETWMKAFETKERERTTISSLKVRSNSVFGYYIEITRSNLESVPNNYTRKQTLVNGERFVTNELKEYEEKILTAQEEIYRIEYELYQETLKEVLSFTSTIQAIAHAIGCVDCLSSFAETAITNNYCKPKMLFSTEIRIQDGRHPVVEALLGNTPFVPNSVHLDPIKQQLLIITGPNMAGKSVFVRQVALITLMAHMGSFVPARSAHIGVVDRIFVRSGASDVITSGLSTFMVEMVETATILHNATEKSLVIMDEIGRGTSTYDGISIAWAVAQYLAQSSNSRAKTLFATHYHELQELEDLFPNRIKNFHMAVVEEKDGPRFVHTMLPGKSLSSFGIAVAKRAGVPEDVIAIAEKKLKELESTREQSPKRQIQEKNALEEKIIQRLLLLQITNMTPLEALNELAQLQRLVKD